MTLSWQVQHEGQAPTRRHRLRAMLADLKLPAALEALDAILHDGGSVTAGEAIESLLRAQIGLRNSRRLQAAMRSSRLPAVKQLADFDFTFQPSIRREQIESLHELGFAERKENAVLLGPPGVGKSHLAISLAIGAAQTGSRVYYGALADLITNLEEAQAAGELAQRMKVFTYAAVRVVEMFFLQMIARRYERASSILNSNKRFEDWGDVFGDEVMTAALIERLLHHCYVINVRGNFYRIRRHTQVSRSLNSGDSASAFSPRKRHPRSRRSR